MAKKNSMTSKTDQELITLLAETRAKLRQERFAAAGARPKDPNMPQKLRKTIARILTEQGQRTRKVSPHSASLREETPSEASDAEKIAK